MFDLEPVNLVTMINLARQNTKMKIIFVSLTPSIITRRSSLQLTPTAFPIPNHAPGQISLLKWIIGVLVYSCRISCSQQGTEWRRTIYQRDEAPGEATGKDAYAKFRGNIFIVVSELKSNDIISSWTGMVVLKHLLRPLYSLFNCFNKNHF